MMHHSHANNAKYIKSNHCSKT